MHTFDITDIGVYIICDLYYYSKVGVYLRHGTTSNNTYSFTKIFGDDFNGTISTENNTYTLTTPTPAGKVIRVGGTTNNR